MTDRVGHVIEAWRRLQPDWDLTGMAVFGRLARLQRTIELQRAPVLADAGLTSSDVDLLSALLRSPDGLRPRDLRAHMMVGSGTLTAGLDRLEEAGYLQRRPDPDDRRGRIIFLTDTGRDILVVVVQDLLEVENRLLASSPPEVVHTLAHGLEAIIGDLEQPLPSTPDST